MRTQKQTAAGPRLGLILLAALIGVPLLEIALFIKVGGWIGLGPTLALIVLTRGDRRLDRPLAGHQRAVARAAAAGGRIAAGRCRCSRACAW